MEAESILGRDKGKRSEQTSTVEIKSGEDEC